MAPSGDSPTDDPAAPGTPDALSVSGRQVALWLLVSLAALMVVGYFTFDAAAFREALGHARPWLLAAALGMAIARIGFGGWRLRYVSGGRLGLAEATRGQIAWYFFANLTPTVIGGGPVATFYVARDADLPVGRSAALMFFCMLLNQLWFVAAIPVLMAADLRLDLLPAETAGAWGTSGLLLGFAGLFVWGLAFAYFTLVRPRRLVELAEWVLRWPLLRRFRERGMREMRSYFRRARRLRGEPPLFFVRGFLLTAPIWLARYAVVSLVVLSLTGADSLLLYLRSAAMMLIGLIMPTPGGSGGMEGLYALFIGPLVPETVIAPTLFLWRLLDYYLFIALGALLVVHLRSRTGPATEPAGGQGG